MRTIPNKSVTSSSWLRILPYAILSLGGFICALLLVGVLLWKPETIQLLGLIGGFYYFVLLLLGLAVAAFLFGALRSFATYSGKQLGGALELGGPIVGCALVVIGGFVFAKPLPEAFAVTAYVHGDGGPHDLVLRNTGLVWMTLGADRRAERIGDKGQADFKGIPSRFRGQEVPVSVEADGYELAERASKHRLEGDQLYVSVRKKPAQIFGRVQDPEGKPISDTVISVAGIAVTNDAMGRFELTIPGVRLQRDLSLRANAIGFAPANQLVAPGANELTVILRRQP